MNAIDTNVVVRLLTADDSKQFSAARKLFQSGPIWIPSTVFLETAWVLSSLYQFSDADISQAFVRLLGMGNVHTEDKSAVADAVALISQGVEIADALHLSFRAKGARFYSFDRALVRQASRAGAAAVLHPA